MQLATAHAIVDVGRKRIKTLYLERQATGAECASMPCIAGAASAVTKKSKANFQHYSSWNIDRFAKKEHKSFRWVLGATLKILAAFLLGIISAQTLKLQRIRQIRCNPPCFSC